MLELLDQIMGSLLNDVNLLITKRVGDLSRLEHIKETIENNNKLYDSDRKYIDDLSEKHLFSKEIPNDEPKLEQTIPIKEELSDETIIDHPTDTTSQDSRCGNCGTSNEKGHDFCSKCGVDTKSQEESFCSKCGTKILGNGSCSNCNSSQHNQVQQNNPNQMSPRPHEWKSEGTTLILTIVLGLFGFGGIGHIYLGAVTRGIVILIVGFILLIVAILSMGIGFIILIPFAIWVVFDARNKCKFYNDYLEQNQQPPW